MHTLSTALDALRRRFPGAARVYAPGATGEPTALAEAFRAAPERADGLTFTGVWVPGLNATDWAGLHAGARAETIFLSAALRPSFEAGRTALLPLSYPQAYRRLETTPLDAAFFMVSPPDEAGEVSLGVCADFGPAVLHRADVFKVAVVNPAMPCPPQSPRMSLDAFDLTCEAETPLIQTPPVDLPTAFAAIGGHIAGLVEDGDTLQFGLGTVQQAALGALKDHKALRIHSGMVSDPVLDLMDAGALAEDDGAVVTGIAAGTDQLYTRIAEARQVQFAPVRHTHSHAVLSAVPRLKAINSAIEIDLFGQANAEFIGGRQVSGIGGLGAFLRGAADSPGGRGIVALASTARSGTVSRIVPRLPADATTLARTDLDTVITEHGVADLREKDIEARAEALIAVAAPAFRDGLAAAWTEMRAAQ